MSDSDDDGNPIAMATQPPGTGVDRNPGKVIQGQSSSPSSSKLITDEPFSSPNSKYPKDVCRGQSSTNPPVLNHLPDKPSSSRPRDDRPEKVNERSNPVTFTDEPVFTLGFDDFFDDDDFSEDTNGKGTDYPISVSSENTELGSKKSASTSELDGMALTANVRDCWLGRVPRENLDPGVWDSQPAVALSQQSREERLRLSRLKREEFQKRRTSGNTCDVIVGNSETRDITTGGGCMSGVEKKEPRKIPVLVDSRALSGSQVRGHD